MWSGWVLAGWSLVLAGGFVAALVGGTLLSRHHGDRWEVVGVLVVGLSAVAGLAWAGAQHAMAGALVALASGAGLFAGYHRNDAGPTA